ncbi:hypothetical protein Tco_0300407 [Tanacetum coccineum]
MKSSLSTREHVVTVEETSLNSRSWKEDSQSTTFFGAYLVVVHDVDGCHLFKLDDVSSLQANLYRPADRISGIPCRFANMRVVARSQDLWRRRGFNLNNLLSCHNILLSFLPNLVLEKSLSSTCSSSKGNRIVRVLPPLTVLKTIRYSFYIPADIHPADEYVLSNLHFLKESLIEYVCGCSLRALHSASPSIPTDAYQRVIQYLA